MTSRPHIVATLAVAGALARLSPLQPLLPFDLYACAIEFESSQNRLVAPFARNVGLSFPVAGKLSPTLRHIAPLCVSILLTHRLYS